MSSQKDEIHPSCEPTVWQGLSQAVVCTLVGEHFTRPAENVKSMAVMNGRFEIWGLLDPNPPGGE